MKPVTVSSAVYSPQQAPTTLDELARYTENELRKVAAVVTLLAAGHVDTSYSAPTKPREGDVRLADGTTWKPNGTGGKGVWAYYSGIWNLLG